MPNLTTCQFNDLPGKLSLHALLVTVAVTLLFAKSINTATAAEATEPDTGTSPWQWLEGRRYQLSRGVTALGRNLDDWLAGENIGELTNETFLRVRLHQQAGSLDGYHSKLKIGGSLDLPRTSERWKLIFETDNDELNSLQDNVLGEDKSGEAVGGFRYLQELGEDWELTNEIGLRGRLPLDPYYRLRARYEHSLGDTWSLGFSQKIWYYRTDGWGYDTDVMFSRPIAADKVLDISSEVKYQQSRRQKEFGQSVSIHQALGDLRTLSYTLGLLGLSEPNIRVNDYYVEARYRRALREDWLFLEVVPQVVVSRSENWRPESRILLNLELMFFDF